MARRLSADEVTTVWVERIGYSLCAMAAVAMFASIFVGDSRQQQRRTAFSQCVIEKMGDQEFCAHWANVNYTRF
jgi:hypothetical protein